MLREGGLSDDRVNPRIMFIYSPFSHSVEAGFTAYQVSSDGGALLLREVDRKINLLGRLAGCFSNRCDQGTTAFISWRNCSRELSRPYFSKLACGASVRWECTFHSLFQFCVSSLWIGDLCRVY
jgi:hypothetical protein